MTVGKEYELGRINDIEFQMSWYHNLLKLTVRRIQTIQTHQIVY